MYKGTQIRREAKGLYDQSLSERPPECDRLIEFLAARRIRRAAGSGLNYLKFVDPLSGRPQPAYKCLRLVRKLALGPATKPIQQMCDTLVESIKSEDIDKIRKAAEPLLLLFGHEL